MVRLTAFVFICIALQIYKQVESKTVPKKVEKQVIFSKVEYEVNKDFMDMEVVLKNGTDALPTVDLDANLNIDLIDGLYISNIISKRTGQEYHALIKTGRMNMCDYFKKPDREPFLKLLLETLNRYGHMMFECPVKKGKYYLKDFKLDASNLPAFTPVGDYRVDFSVSKKEGDAFVLVFRMYWYAMVIEN